MSRADTSAAHQNALVAKRHPKTTIPTPAAAHGEAERLRLFNALPKLMYVAEEESEKQHWDSGQNGKQ